MELHIYRDEIDDLRANCGEPYRPLSAFLEGDLQSDPTAAAEILENLDHIQAGDLARWQRTGNAFTLTLVPEGATLESELEDTPPCHLPHCHLRRALEAWRAMTAERRP